MFKKTTLPQTGKLMTVVINLQSYNLYRIQDEFDRYMGGHSSHLEDALSARVTAGLASNIDRLKESEDKLRQLHNNQVKA